MAGCGTGNLSALMSENSAGAEFRGIASAGMGRPERRSTALVDQRGGDQIFSRKLSLGTVVVPVCGTWHEEKGKKSLNDDPLDELRVVDYKDDPLECRKCGQELSKANGWRFPDAPEKKHREPGQAYCLNSECSLGNHLISWIYRYSRSSSKRQE